MRNVLFIAWQDLRQQFKSGATLLWLFVMPPIFFYYIGTVTGGFSDGIGGTQAVPLAVVAEQPGFLKDQLDQRLRDNAFLPQWYESAVISTDEPEPIRTLSFEPQLTTRVLAGEQVAVRYETGVQALSRQSEIIRIQRSLYTALADIVVADATDTAPLTPQALETLNTTPRIWELQVSPAGERKQIPSGFDQAVPGILVMFTLLVLLTSGASMLAIERLQGLLRRLAYTPLTRTEIVAGKWASRMGLAVVQVTTALLVGTFVFKMHWGPNFAMVLLVLGSWAAFCASAGLLLGCVARTAGQASGFGVLLANSLAALGGCWWPIEITPDWMQALQKMIPTGWAMDALHKLINFEAGAESAVPHVAALLLGAIFVSWLAVRRFRYE